MIDELKQQIIAKFMSQQYVKIKSSIGDLLSFQENFLTLVHSQVYHSGKVASQAMLKFQIIHLSEANEKFDQLISLMSKEFIEKKVQSKGELRDQFQKLLHVDFLPLLRVNRYEITKISLFAFDVYIDPLEAFLHILSRLETLSKPIISNQLTLPQSLNAEGALQKGWDQYIDFSQQWKLSFNIYMLKEYLNVGSKSFLRKDREILFTGINNFFEKILPKLKEKGKYRLLSEIAQLNNSTYIFHQSFNYFHFYAKLLPLTDDLFPVFSHMKEIAEKCQRTNIITPLLFGFLRHKDSFTSFIRQADSQIWLPFLNAIVGGIAINLKFRILQYHQILQIFQEATLKAGLLGKIRTDEIIGQLQLGWKDAKQFFISAIKLGFNSGDAQSWRIVDFQLIGNRVIDSIINGILVNPQSNRYSIKTFLASQEQILDKLIQKLTDNKVDLSFIKTAIYQLEVEIDDDRKICDIIMVIQLFNLIGFTNEYVLYFLVTSLSKITRIASKIVKLRLQQSTNFINQMIFKLDSVNLTFLKDKLLIFHQKYLPLDEIRKVISLYSKIFDPKKSISSLLSFNIPDNLLKDYFLQIISRYVPKPSKKKLIIKTFDKQISTLNDYVNVPYETHCFLHNITVQLANGKDKNIEALKLVPKLCPWVSFALLNFPIHGQGQLCSFSSWLIDNPSNHYLLCSILKYSKDIIKSDEGEDLIQLLIRPNILDTICKKLNETTDIEALKKLCSLSMNIICILPIEESFFLDLITIEQYILINSNDTKSVVEAIQNLFIFIHEGFKEKLPFWLMNLYLRKIEGKVDMSNNRIKKTLKSTNSNIYFLGETTSIQNEDKVIYQDFDDLKAKLGAFEITYKNKEISSQLYESLMGLSKLNFEAFNQLNNKQNVIFLEEAKEFGMSSLPENILKEIFDSKDYLVIQFVSLNLQNCLKFIEMGIQQKRIEYLCTQRLLKGMNRLIPQILLLGQQKNIPILNIMSQNLSIQQKISIAQYFYLQNSILPSYCRHLQGIEYLTVFNVNNWRILNDYFTKQFSSTPLSSIILQYNEFLSITGQKNSQYEKNIDRIAEIFSKFVCLFLYKIDSIHNVSASEEEIGLRSSNELSSLNIIASSLMLKDVLIKMAKLNKNLIQNKLGPMNEWIQIILRLNTKINHCFNGDMLLSDFIYGYYFTNQSILLEHKTQIGIYIEIYYRQLGDNINRDELYWLTKTNLVEKDVFDHLKSYKGEVLHNQLSKSTEIHQSYSRLLRQLQQSGCVFVKENVIHLNYTHQKSDNRFYALGCYHSLLQTSSRLKLDPFLEKALQREILTWQLLKEIDNEEYTQIKSILSDPQVSKRSLKFEYKGQPLIPQGENLRVNDYNKIDYCNKIGLRVIGQNLLQNISLFLRGYYNQENGK